MQRLTRRATLPPTASVAGGKGDFVEVEPNNVDYMDVSPKQLVSVAAGLIPFLEHDDANRALMGSNMQRQAVPLLVTEAPFVATGLEERVARDSRAVLVTEEGGKVASVTGNQIILTSDGKLPETKKRIRTSADDGVFVYSVRKFMRSNAATCINQKILVEKGDTVKKGPGHRGRSLHFGWRAGSRSQRALRVHARGTVTTSRTRSSSASASSRTTFSPRFTSRNSKSALAIRSSGRKKSRAISRTSARKRSRISGPDGVIRVGAEVKPGDILVGKITPKSETELAPEERLLRAIFG
jgi:DNA-directed RNA polymerase subunit beta